MNKASVFILFLLIILNGCNSKTTDKSSTANNDSIQKYIALASNDTLDFDKRIKYNDKILSFIDLRNNDSVKRYALYFVSFRYHLLRKKEESKKTASQLLQLSSAVKDTLSLGFAYRTLGLYHTSVSNNEKAIEYLFKAKKLFNSVNNKGYVLKTMMDIAITQSYACDYLGSNNTAFKTLSLAKKMGFTELDFKLKKIIANNLSSLKQNERAIEYFMDLNQNYSDLNEKQELNVEIASCYIDLKEYDKAFDYLNKFLEDKKARTSNPDDYAQCISLLGLYKTEKGDYSNLPNLFFKADSIFKRVNSLSARNYNQIYLSKYYFKRKEILSAINAAKRSLEISREYKNPDDVLISLNQLLKVDKKEAQIYAQEYIRINDSMQIAERNFRDKFARIAYETEEITQQKDTALKQRSIIIAVALTLLVISLLIFIIARQRLKQKELRLQQTQQNANEEIYQLMLSQKGKEEAARQIEKKRIGLELHDGVMNKLASTRLNLSVLSINRDDNAIEQCLSHINDIQNIEKEIRNIAHDLNQDVFDQYDTFGKLLDDFVEEQNKNSDTLFILEVNSSIDWNTISNSTKMNLYRVIQEASHNINKHAKAKKAIISILIDNNNICLSITDDGIGFNAVASEKGIGLKNMNHRVKTLNGKFSVSSKTNSVTSINIAIPLKGFN
ncbi:tetratricopeptide repeat-containing sensor histidine kinase [Flavobacterium terrisoli]|uniref:tetratricopeptide repeat-containing sensor histidine kinase n=1 Tax=Flavobacterium terrisoli TaxID=3242195 RepID=UPI0025439906|nr:ATP-binding protein [Flavobacterium buctense]